MEHLDKATENLEKAISTLKNPAAGWATRKETAHHLGDWAVAVIEALRGLKDDADQDVRNAVRAALKRLPLLRAGGEPTTPRAYTLEELAAHFAKPGRRTVQPHGDGFQIEVHIDAERAQDVFVRPHEKDDGTQMIRVYTICGKPDASTAAWALRANGELIGCGFAVENHERFEHLILVENFHRENATPGEVLAAVKQIAYYGDWLERRLSSQDVF